MYKLTYTNKHLGKTITYDEYITLRPDQKFGYWEPYMITNRGFKINNRSKDSYFDCGFDFIDDDFELGINLDAYRTNGNYFNFRSVKGKWNGHFSVRLYTEEELDMLLEFFRRKRK